MNRLVVLVVACNAALALAPEPAQVDAQVQALAEISPLLHYELAGRSPGGRPIPLVIVSGRPNALDQQLRVLVIARQHGYEPAPARAALRWLQVTAAQGGPFGDVAVFCLPTLNPDGAAAGTRANGAGVDLNRDWLAQTQPETRLAVRLFKRWQPHLVVDLHEFWDWEYGDLRPGHGEVQPEWLEILSSGQPTATLREQLNSQLLSSLTQRLLAGGDRFTPVRTDHAAHNLAHRYFALRHQALTLLVEVKDGHDEREARVLSLLCEGLSESAATLKPSLDRLRGTSRWRQPVELLPTAPRPVGGVTVPPAPVPAPPPPSAPASWFAAAYAVVLLARAKFLWADADIELS